MRIYYQDKRTAKLIERLAKELHISSAANDAAGLAISEKMKAQIRGLDQANQLPNNVLTLLR